MKPGRFPFGQTNLGPVVRHKRRTAASAALLRALPALPSRPQWRGFARCCVNGGQVGGDGLVAVFQEVAGESDVACGVAALL